MTSWRGIFPALCTPFDDDGAIDLAAQRRVVRFALDAGAHGLVCFGLAGEVLKLSADERRALVETIVDEADGQVPVLVGAGAESIAVSSELARHAEAIGADGIVLPAPVSARLDGPALVDYLAQIAGATALPVMIQDAPAYLGQAVGAGTVLRVAERADNVRHVKLEAGPSELRTWIDELGPGFGVWGGDAGMYQLDALRIGAAGLIPGADLVDLLVEAYEAEIGGDRVLAESVFRRVLPMIVFEIQLSIDHFNACAKRVLVQRGVLDNASLRPPATAFGDASLRLLGDHLAALDLADVRASSVG